MVDRAGAGTLKYTAYTGNQLNTVTGYSPRTYVYDGNGNATSDGNGQQIDYNMLNLPQDTKRSGAIVATYTYDATGQKLRNTGNDANWDYINGIVYRNGAIDFISTEEGRVVYNSGTYTYEYNLKDHLGNNRVSFDSNAGVARVLQEDEYYSFGLRKSNYAHDNRYLYNGKEVQIDLITQYDYGARFYDPVIARWTTIDPLAEMDRKYSPYVYGRNNPIRMIDPDGMSAVDDIISETQKEFTQRIDINIGINNAVKGSENSNTSTNNEVVTNTSTNVTDGGGKNNTNSTGGTKSTNANQGGGSQAKGFGDTPGMTVHYIESGNNWSYPGVGIFVNKHQGSITAVIQHEYGHYLQFLKHGSDYTYYDRVVAIPSSWNLLWGASNYDHDRMGIELEATTLAHDFYGKYSLLNNFQFPTFYTNPQATPVQRDPNPYVGYENIDAGFASGFH